MPLKSTTGCVDFKHGFEVLASSEGGFVISVNEQDIYVIGNSSSKKIGTVSRLNPLQFTTRGNLIAWVDQFNSSTLNIADLSNLSDSNSQTLNEHCTLAKVNGVKDSGIPVVCHDYKSGPWVPSTSSSLDISLKLYNMTESHKKAGSFTLKGLTQFRYVKELWFDP